ncbi:DISEASE RESISTANCE PROTEIN RP [Salix purpurea]|uniref:DISEASE RESISTANCE PROTEIN RP n=1 Tax=Salix purpurea TaxID=77065 RepID=A0A9Q0VGU5_SALPP|nr:DISEASE RESISTANCE PROTEIN RP [Salix purpurea]
MAEPLISLLLERFTMVLFQQVQEEVNIVQGVKKQADKLKSNLIDIQSVLEDAERKQVKEKAVRVWLDKLKDVCYDMDDVLDEWSYAVLRWKTGDAEENIHNHQKIRCSFLGSSCFCLNQVVRRRDIALKIKEVSEKVDEIANERARHGLQIYRATDEIQRPTSTPFFDELSVSGRDGEKKSVVSMLLAEMDGNNHGEASVETSTGRVRSLNVSRVFNQRNTKRGVTFMPKGIERLTCLRTLDWFIVCGGGENESKAANLRELKNLNHIGGSLEIRNLRGGIEDAAEEQLKNKKRLLCLDLYFKRNHEDDILIEGLQPPSDLERLCIDNYGGIVLPNWMMTLTRLKELQLVACGNVEVLPPFGRLPNLESLKLKGVGVRRLDAGFLGIEEVENDIINEGEIARVTAFPKLKRLVIWDLEEVEEWDGTERRVGEELRFGASIIIMPQLRELTIFKCPLLRALPDYVLAAPLQLLDITALVQSRDLRVRIINDQEISKRLKLAVKL